MGRDVMSVVDAKLKLYGVDGLRVADASICLVAELIRTSHPSGSRRASLL
jgi:choline dehydrogenase